MAGYSAAQTQGAGYYPPSLQGVQATQVGLPTDAGYGMSATGPPAPTPNQMTQRVDRNAMAAQGANVRKSYSGAGNFERSWYAAHPDAWHAAGWAAGDSWNAASWSALVPALGLAVSVQPIPYDYGANITYQGNQVYSGGQPVASCDQYYQQAAALAQSAPPPDPRSPDWIPLGVFALVQTEQSTPQYVMQLGLNKSGAIAGNYCDLISKAVHPIQGAVDRNTQRVAWTVGSNKNTVGETGLANLTKNEAPVLLHIGPDKTQQWLLVRLPPPQN